MSVPEIVTRTAQPYVAIRGHVSMAEIGAFADGVIVGSALVTAAAHGLDPVRSLTAELAGGVRSATVAS